MRLRQQLRQSWTRSNYQHLALVGLSFWALYAHYQYRVTGLWLAVLLPAAGFSLGILSLALFLKHYEALSTHPLIGRILTLIERTAVVPLIGFTLSGFIVQMNGSMDFSEPVERQSRIESIHKKRFELGRRLVLAWGQVQSWEQPEQTVWLLLGEPHLWGGEVITVGTHPGYWGIPWVSHVERDEVHYVREALKSAPRSATLWQNLIAHYRNRERWQEAADATQAYIKAYPTAMHAYEWASSLGGLLMAHGKNDLALPLLEYVVAGRAHYDDYQSFGHALQDTGKTDRAIEVYKASIALAPHDWEAFFHLGETYAQIGNRAEAIHWYNKIFEVRADFPEVAAIIQGLGGTPQLSAKAQ